MNNMNKKQTQQLKNMALKVALDFHLSDYDSTKTPKQVFNNLKHQDVVVWEPFEYWELSSVEESIDGLAFNVEKTILQALEALGIAQ